jgi:hypothetical protein
MSHWVPRGLIISRIGAYTGSRFKWAGPVRERKDTRPRWRYACTGPCGLRFRSAEPLKYCRTCGGALEGRGQT